SFRGHKAWVSSVAFSDNGHFLVSASTDGKMKVWELSGREGAAGYGHSKEINSVAVSPNGKLAASGSEDGTLRIWDVATAKELAAVESIGSPVTALGFTPDSDLLVVASQDKVLRVLDAKNGAEKHVMREPGPSSFVPVLAVDKDKKTAYVWAALATVEAFDITNGKAGPRLTVHEKPNQVSSLAFSLDGTIAAVGGQDGNVRLWDLKNQKLIGSEFPAHANPVVDLQLSQDDKTLVTAD